MTGGLLKDYAKRCREQLRAGATNFEQALAAEFKRLLEELIPTLSANTTVQVIPEYAKPGVGRPTLRSRRRANRHADLSN